MVIIDVVKCDMEDGEFCHKFPSDNLKIGTQLVVYSSQTAFFVKGGKVCDEFSAGTYTIKTENIPILNKIVNIPFGGDSPFKADVWFINQITKLDIPWGTSHPIQLEDPKYKIIVPVRAHGQYGLHVSNPRLFLETLIGNLSSFTAEKIEQYFKGKIIASINTMLAQQIINEGVSVLDINTQLMIMAESLNAQLNSMFDKYGISIVDFAIMSINVPENDDSVIRLKKAKDLAARLAITGRDVYQMERSFDVLQTAAGNEGAGGQMLAMGAGLGAGVGVGSAMGDIAKQTMNTNLIPPPIQQQTTYYAYINGSQMPNLSVQQLASLVQNGMANGDTLVWTAGMANWVKLNTVPELVHLVGSPVPPPINL